MSDCVAGARVALSQDGKQLAETHSDAFGDFKLDGLPEQSGTYRIDIEADGFAPHSLDVELAESIYVGTIELASAG